MAAVGNLLQGLRPGTQIGRTVGEVDILADHADLEAAFEPALADTSVPNRRFDPRVRADQQQRIGFFNTGEAAVHDVACTAGRIDGSTVLTAVPVDDTQAIQHALQCKDALAIGYVASDCADLASIGAFHLVRDGLQRLLPGCGFQLAVGAAHVRAVEPLALQAITGEPGFVADPLLVHVLIQTWQHAEHFARPGVDPDVRTHRIVHVDALGLCQFPRPRVEGIGFARQRTDWAQVNDIAGHFGSHRLLQRRDFHIARTANRADQGNACNLIRKANAAGAVDAAGHDRLDQRTHILVWHRPLVLFEARRVGTVVQRLVLQIALAALVTDRAIQRVVDQQHLHDALAGLHGHFAVGEDFLVIHGRQCTGCLRLRRSRLHFHQAHAAVASDGEALVIAETGDFLARGLARLQHGAARRYLDLYPVNLECRHSLASPQAAALAWNSAMRASISGRKWRMSP